LKFLISILLLCIQFQGNAQNMIPNPSFEINSGLPGGTGQTFLCTGWGNVNGGIGSPFGTPDYLHDNGGWTVNLPSTVFGLVNAYDGDAIMGVIMFSTSQGTDFREYITVQLTSPMVVGSTYTISFNLTNGESNLYSGSSCNHIGIQFSNGPLSQIDHEPIGGIPQIEIAGEVWTNVWQDYTFNYVADAPYDYLTFGNFYDNASTSTTTQVPNADYPNAAYYFIDQMELLVYQSPLQIQGDTLICTGDPATLTGWDDPINSYAWANQLTPGTIISTDSNITVSPTVNTTYLLYGSVDTLSISVNVEFPPVVDLGNDTTLCIGEVLHLNATAPFSTYLWQDGSTDSTFTISTAGTYYVNITDTTNGCTNSDTINVIECDLGISDLDISFMIFPNPSDGHINVSLSNFMGTIIIVTDIAGRIIYQKSISAEIMNLDISHLNQGTYFLTLMTADGQVLISKKIEVIK
jgi:hypothetical protein